MSFSLAVSGKAGRPELRNALGAARSTFLQNRAMEDSSCPSHTCLLQDLVQGAATALLAQASPELNVVLIASAVPTRNNSVTLTLTVTLYS